MNGQRLVPLINGREVAWCDIHMLIGIVPVTGITAFDFTESQNKENIYGVGQTPIGRGYGNVETSGSITLLRSEIEAIRQSSPTQKLVDIAPFSFTLSYIPMGRTKVVSMVFTDVEFTEDKFGSNQGDTKEEQQLNLIIGSMNYV